MKESTKEALKQATEAIANAAQHLKDEAKEFAKEAQKQTQEISAKLVKELRNKTDAGIMECKNALKECAGNIEEAIELLRKKGLSKAAKKADRIAAEGVIALKVSPDFTKATLIEVNSETDFVAKNEAFQELVANVLDLAYKRSLNTTENLMDTIKRVVEYWNEEIKQDVLEGKKVIIVAHGNSLRGLIKYLDNLSDEEVMNLEIKTGSPICYELNDDLTPIRHYYIEAN